MSSSSRSFPFSFSHDVQLLLGSPDRINAAVRRAVPSLFDGSVAAQLRVTDDETRPRHVVVQTGCTIPAGTPVGLFTGHVYMGLTLRGDRSLGLPPVRVHGVTVNLGLDSSAELGRFPSPVQAGLYKHVCEHDTLVAEWRELDCSPAFEILVALAGNHMHEGDLLCWNFDLHCMQDQYTLGDQDGQAWCADGGAVRLCDCNSPHPCPRDRVLRAPLPAEDASPSEEDSWTPDLGQDAHWTSAYRSPFPRRRV